MGRCWAALLLLGAMCVPGIGREFGGLLLNADFGVLPDLDDAPPGDEVAAQTTIRPGGVKLPDRHPGVRADATTDDCPSAE